MEIKDLIKDMPYKWKVQTCSASGCTMVAYIDARQAMDQLDKVVGPGKWQDKYEEIKGQLYCHVGIKVDDEWVWKTDIGTASKVEKEKGEASDAFKRACVKWGIGRFLYDMEFVWIATFQGKDFKGAPKDLPIHEAKRGNCPPALLKKDKGKPTMFINPFKMDEYVKQVLKK